MYIENITKSEDIKKLSINQLQELANEMREAIIEKCSKYGGHMGSNLGIVELTIAINYVYDMKKDKVVYDVSHQTFPHKILNGRARAFIEENHYNDVVEFTNPIENENDLFHMGHTSTSISLACGLAKARDILHRNERIIAIIGDASLGGGQAYEGLNISAELNSQFLIVLNDNEMSVFDNQGNLYDHLKELRESNGNCNNNIFKAFGFKYVYLENGNSISELINVLSENIEFNKPMVLHIHTQKGKGFKPAEENKARWHYTKPFNLETGEVLANMKTPTENFGNITYECVKELMKTDDNIMVVTASTPSCIGFGPDRSCNIKNNFIDVGIEEQNAISIATGMSKNGGRVIFGTWASFYQRAYDQIAHELCLNNLPVTMLVTNASVLGDPNDTHVGLYDIPMLCSIPNLLYLAPAYKEEYVSMLKWSILNQECPVAIRIPWHGVNYSKDIVENDWSKAIYKKELSGNTVALIALGGFLELGKKVALYLKENYGLSITLINPRFINKIDKETLNSLKFEHKLVATLEDGTIYGGYGAMISQYYSLDEMKVKNFGFYKKVPTEYNPEMFMFENGLTPELISKEIVNIINGE